MATDIITLDADLANKFDDMFENPQMAEHEIKRAMSNALNDAAARGKTVGTRAVRDDYNVKYGAVLKRFKIDKAKVNRLYAEVTVRGTQEDSNRDGAIPLIEFKVSPKKASKKRPRVGVRAKVRKGGTGKRIPGSFIMNMPHGPQVVTRLSKRRNPVKVLYGLNIPSMVKRKEIFNMIYDEMTETLNKRFEHNLQQILAGNFKKKKGLK